MPIATLSCLSWAASIALFSGGRGSYAVLGGRWRQWVRFPVLGTTRTKLDVLRKPCGAGAPSQAIPCLLSTSLHDPPCWIEHVMNEIGENPCR